MYNYYRLFVDYDDKIVIVISWQDITVNFIAESISPLSPEHSLDEADTKYYTDSEIVFDKSRLSSYERERYRRFY